MRTFYEVWSPVLNRQPLAAEIGNIQNEEIVELSFSNTSKPMGVAIYHTSQELPTRLKEVLPDIEELKKLL